MTKRRYYIVYRELNRGLQGGTEAEAHGSILMAAAMLDHAGEFMAPRFDETCTNVLALRTHPSE